MAFAEMHNDQVYHPYQLFMLALCLYALAALALDSFFQVQESTRQLLEYADTGVCLLFFLDFILSLIHAPKRWQYFFTWGWLDLASSIPMLGLLRWGRAARIMRIFRVLRGARATKIIASFVLKRRAESVGLAAALVSLLLLIFSSIAVLHFEKTASEANIKSAEDAVWWAFATITTVGYGDRYPVTSEGRIVAMLLMVAGVGLFGTLSGFIAAWFLSPENQQQKNELENLRQEIRQLRELIE